MKDENLVEDAFGYSYFHHSQHPLDIQVSETEDNIQVRVRQYYKQHMKKELIKGAAKTGVMSKEQVEDFILDVIEIFLRKE